LFKNRNKRELFPSNVNFNGKKEGIEKECMVDTEGKVSTEYYLKGINKGFTLFYY
jgi:hypothetical protein